MKIYFTYLLLTTTIASTALAASPPSKRGTASKTDPIKGLNCTIEYKPVNGFRFIETSAASGNWILGDKSTATLKDRLAGPKVTLEALEAGKKDFYRLKISGKKGEVANAIFEWGPSQVLVPAKVTENESEDPTSYDQMRVTCETTYLAG